VLSLHQAGGREGSDQAAIGTDESAGCWWSHKAAGLKQVRHLCEATGHSGLQGGDREDWWWIVTAVDWQMVNNAK
jgi:hypothetical protein